MKSNNFFRYKLNNGLTLLFEKRKLPIISTICSAKFGGAYENERNKGIAHFIEHSVFETKKRTSQHINIEIEKKGGEWNAFTSEEETAFWIKIDSKHFESSSDIISDVMFNPIFSKKNIEKERGIILQEIKMYHDLPNFHVFDNLKKTLYYMPFSIPIIGSEKNILEIKQNDLINFHRKYYVPSNMVLVVSGNRSFEEVKEIIKRYFGKKIPSSPAKIREIVPLNKTKEIIEKRPHLDQAHLAFGFLVPSRKEKGRYAAELLNASLGLGMSSPLVQEIREKRGWAYSVKSDLDQGNNYGYCYVYAGVKKESPKKVKEIILNEIKKLRKLEKSNLEQTKEQLIGRYFLDMENSMKTAQNLMNEELSGNAEEYFSYPEKISEVKLSDVRNLAKIKHYGLSLIIPTKL